MTSLEKDLYLPHAVEIVQRTQDSSTIFTLKTRFVDPTLQAQFRFRPGQFNMLSLFGVGEVPISISSDPDDHHFQTHTIRAIGRVTKAMQLLKKGDQLGLRGPFGQGWPVLEAEGKDIVVITGGLGCAPSVSVIDYILRRRHQYGALKILQGVKHSDDFIFRKQYDIWQQSPHTVVHIAADTVGPKWPWGKGFVTDMIQGLDLNPNQTIAMLCGPEMMMHAAITALCAKQVPENKIYLSMERNMACGIGHCGHCQYGGLFVCKDGPVFAFSMVKSLFHEKGF